MGLDTTHNAFHGAYSSFYRFRTELLEMAENIDANTLQSWGGNKPISIIKDEGLQLFINHSDCDDDYTPDECKKMADSISILLPKMDNQSELYTRSLQFRDGCLLAFSRNENLEFG